MPIEFRCTHCQRLLRTADNTAGKQTKCPECGQIVRIPSPGPAAAAAPPPTSSTAPVIQATGRLGAAVPPVQQPPASNPFGSSAGQIGGAAPPRQATNNPFAASGGAAAMPSASLNPYSSPAARGLAPGSADVGRGQLEVCDVMDRAWKIYVENLGQLILGMFVYLIVGMFGMLGLALILLVGFGIGGALGNAGNDEVGVAVIVIAATLFGVLLFGFSIWLVVGLFRWILAVARGQPSSIGMLFSGGPYILPALGAGILVTLATTLGYIACIVPGLILAVLFSQFLWLIIDRKAGAIESLGQSVRLTEGNRMSLFLFFLIAFGISFVGGFIPFSFLFTAPFIYLMMAVAYLRMTRQPTADLLINRPPQGMPMPPR
jgi:phage FluMu protein Com